MRRSSVGLAAVLTATALLASCGGPTGTTVDPGPNFVIESVQFNQNYFFCVIEPQIIMGGLTGTACGDNGSHGCHYSDKVPEMPLQQLLQPVQCSGGVPVDMTQVASGTAPANNFSSVSFQMNTTYTEANIYLWPTQLDPGHPVLVYASTDTAVVSLIMNWAGMSM